MEKKKGSKLRSILTMLVKMFSATITRSCGHIFLDFYRVYKIFMDA